MDRQEEVTKTEEMPDASRVLSYKTRQINTACRISRPTDQADLMIRQVVRSPITVM